MPSEVSITARPFFESIGFRVVRQQVTERRAVSLQNFVMEGDIELRTIGMRMPRRPQPLSQNISVIVEIVNGQHL
jgi:hypothetical protein